MRHRALERNEFRSFVLERNEFRNLELECEELGRGILAAPRCALIGVRLDAST